MTINARTYASQYQNFPNGFDESEPRPNQFLAAYRQSSSSLTDDFVGMAGGSTFNNVGAALSALQTGAPVQYSASGNAGWTGTTFAGVTQTNNVTANGVVSVSGGSINRQITGVADGAVNAASTDAISGSQLFNTATALDTKATNIGAGLVAGLGGGASITATAVVSVGAAGKERQVTNVAAGVVSATSTDAVNGSQLFAVGSAVTKQGTGLAAALGGGAAVAPDGTVTAPTYTVAGGTQTSVGGALTALDGKVAGLSNGTVGIVQQTGGAPRFRWPAHRATAW